MISASEMKNLVAIVAVAFTFVGYVPYVRDVVAHKTRPHVYSWVVWGVVTLLAFGLQLTHGAGLSSAVSLAAGVICVVIAVLAVRMGDLQITKMDTTCFVLSIVSVVAWVLAESPLAAIVLVSLADVLAFAPTVRKSWERPYDETLSTYVMNAIRFGMVVYALQRYSIVTVLYPATWVIVNGAFSFYLITRRRAISHPSSK